MELIIKQTVINSERKSIKKNSSSSKPYDQLLAKVNPKPKINCKLKMINYRTVSVSTTFSKEIEIVSKRID